MTDTDTIPPEPYSVLPYSPDALVRQVALASNQGDAAGQQLGRKPHLSYLHDYLGALAAGTILVERGYIDRHYTEDHSEYYVRCFRDYRKTCTRLHFFSRVFDGGNFAALLNRESSPIDADILQESYLGFVVVKPLPLTVIGRTCLKAYPAGGTRNYPIMRPYRVSLFGIPLSCESLAFQEQDAVVAACATSALWSAFHGTGVLFDHQISSPVQITKMATALVPVQGRVFPNRGLTTEMMAQAIRGIPPLDPLHENVPRLGGEPDLHWLLCNLYAYIRARIPVLLGMGLFDSGAPSDILGNHAVTVTGYNLGASPALAPRNNQCRMKAARIDKLYVHDDQVGPFARMTLDPGAGNLQTGIDPSGDVRARPEMILVPLHNKIRIPFTDLYKLIERFSRLLEDALSSSGDFGGFEWDVFLSDNNSFKADLFENLPAGAQRERLLLRPGPRFLWRAIALHRGGKAFELTFDATDIVQGGYFLDGIVHNDHVRPHLLKAAVASPGFYDPSEGSLPRGLVDWLQNLDP